MAAVQTFASAMDAALDNAMSSTGLEGSGAPLPAAAVVTPATAAAAAAPTATAAGAANAAAQLGPQQLLSRVTEWCESAVSLATRYANTQVLALSALFLLSMLVLLFTNPPFVQHSVPGQHPLEDGPVSFKLVVYTSLFVVFLAVVAPFVIRNRGPLLAGFDRLLNFRVTSA